MVVCGRDVGILAEVDAHATSEDSLAIERLPYGFRGFDVVEDNDDAAERFQGRPSVNGRMLIYQASNGLKVVRLEDFGIIEILRVVSTEITRLAV